MVTRTGVDRKHLAVDLGNRPRPAYGLVPWQPLAAPAQPGQGRVAPAGLGLEAVVMVWLLRDCYPRWAETGHNLAGEIYTVLGHSLKPGREATPRTSGKHETWQASAPTPDGAALSHD
jgi:hypothetical protein